MPVWDCVCGSCAVMSAVYCTVYNARSDRRLRDRSYAYENEQIYKPSRGHRPPLPIIRARAQRLLAAALMELSEVVFNRHRDTIDALLVVGRPMAGHEVFCYSLI